LFAYYWGAVLIALPFIFRYDYISLDTRYLDILYVKDFFFVFFSFLSIVCFGIGTIKKQIKVVLVIMAIMAFGVHSIYSVNGYYQFIHYFTGVMLLAQFLSKWDAKCSRIATIAIKVTCLLQCLVVFAQCANLDPYKMTISTFIDKNLIKMQREVQEIKEKKFDDPDLVIGTLGNRNHSAALIATTAPLFFSSPLFFIPILAALYLLQTSASWAALLVALVVFLSFKIQSKEKKFAYFFIWTLIGLAAIEYLTKSVGYFNDAGRFEVWRKTIDIIRLRDIPTGRGLGHFSDFFVRHYGLIHWNKFHHVHNEFLEVVYGLGFLGVCCFIRLLLEVRKAKSAHFCCLFAILVNCFFNFYFHISVLALIGIIIYVILYFEQQGESHGF